MIKKQGKEQIYSGSFIADEGEEVLVNVNHQGSPLPLSFQVRHTPGGGVNSSMTWGMEGGRYKFIITAFARGLIGLSSIPLTELGAYQNRRLYIELAYNSTGGNAKLVNVFLYLEDKYV